jgi:hypothetical protein
MTVQPKTQIDRAAPPKHGIAAIIGLLQLESPILGFRHVRFTRVLTGSRTQAQPERQHGGAQSELAGKR